VRRESDVPVLVVGPNDVNGLTTPMTLARSSRPLLDALVSLGALVVMSSLPEFLAMRLLSDPMMEAVVGFGALVGAYLCAHGPDQHGSTTHFVDP
jgi:hypothetical protein